MLFRLSSKFGRRMKSLPSYYLVSSGKLHPYFFIIPSEALMVTFLHFVASTFNITGLPIGHFQFTDVYSRIRFFERALIQVKRLQKIERLKSGNFSAPLQIRKMLGGDS